MSLVQEGRVEGIFRRGETLLRKSVDAENPQEKGKLYNMGVRLQRWAATGSPVDPGTALAAFREGITDVEDMLAITEEESAKPEDEVPRSNDRDIFSQLLRREQNPSEAENSSHSSTGSRPWFSAKGDKTSK